jgi:mRNA interferase MazF
VYVVDFNPRVRTKPGKIRPAVVLQDDLLNEASYPSTVVLPTTTRLVETTSPLRLRLPAGTAGLERESDVLVAQVIGGRPGALLAAPAARLRLVLGH